ncbi:unnamed protein product [Clonostachys chloroleuca]|uniref:DUF676 domain-containing protein n=1 Tax=Clonostachys chloroleuca TaxID=1926264 RepID=A0AA35QG50_9HYPO|nr:unnamed protein product [Clonostachys chloroleuca]CAI6098932.1 unnamed protein product [Clonostachys chloroleuca]CAI6101417.1 unnamed protein product [Clonostachys chloroleuca]
MEILGAGIGVVTGVAGAAGDVIEFARRTGTELGQNTFQAVSDPGVTLATAENILRHADVDNFRSLLSQVTERTEQNVRQEEANSILNAASTIFCRGAEGVVRSIVFEVMRCTLVAIGQADFAQAILIWREIFTNDVNRETLSFILEHKSDLASFLTDLIEPAKLYATALSRDGSPNGGNSHGRYNAYNELDLAKAMTRHTVICQLQRLAKSLSHIFLMGKEDKPLDQLPMNTTLRSDFCNNGTVILPPVLTIRAPDNINQHGEQWLFVNGIGGEYFWLQLYCEKLRDTFNRDIKGIFNRSDGILWDLIECAGERDTDERQNTLIERTQSSMAAQRALSHELSIALQNENSNGYIVMIAYSQGCLLLRLVLQDFIRNNAHRNAMRDRLMIFTFGNPSIDWMGRHEAQKIRLCEYVKHTEHFANEKDFVARLGVLRTDRAVDRDDRLRRLGYLHDTLHDNSLLFTNRSEDWIGHLFGTQYSLRAQEYVDGNRSKLLACTGGRAMTG